VTVIVSREEPRGCGYRKPSAGGVGIYLVGPKLSSPCGKLPFPLEVCPCCSAGIKPSRGGSWVTPRAHFVKSPECGNADPIARGRSKRALPTACQLCPIGNPPEGRHGILWIGEKFYRPDEFLIEAQRFGVSRKISAIPKGFELGKTWVYLGHRHAVSRAAIGQEPELHPGIFSAFLPTGVDLVISDASQVPERAERLAKVVGDGARVVVVERMESDTLAFASADDDAESEEE
jgi:hypothetical protein